MTTFSSSLLAFAAGAEEEGTTGAKPRAEKRAEASALEDNLEASTVRARSVASLATFAGETTSGAGAGSEAAAEDDGGEGAESDDGLLLLLPPVPFPLLRGPLLLLLLLLLRRSREAGEE